MNATPEAAPRTSSPLRAAAGSFVGGAMEWYDFIVFGTAAALVVDDLFFPATDPAAATLLALVTFGLAFVARPVGGVVFGHVGDRYGRRTALLATLVLMGVATVGIGLLPTYDVLGGWSIALLVALRLAQGLAAGGELGGAAALAVESAPPGRRGLLGAFALSGASAGIALGSGVFALVLLLPRDQVLAWGWRIPFLVSVLVVLVGVVVRRAVEEPEVFEAARAHPQARRSEPPVLEVLRRHGSRVAVAVAVYSAGIVAFYLLTVYSLTYAKANLAPPVAGRIETAITIATVLNVAMTLLWGALSDRVGRRPVVVLGCLVQAVSVVAFFAVLPSGDLLPILAATVATLSFGQAAVVGVAPSYFAEMFSTRLRVTGVSLAIGLSAIVGGATPLVAAAIVDADDGWQTVAAVAAGICVLACLATVATRETRGTDIAREEDARPEAVPAAR